MATGVPPITPAGPPGSGLMISVVDAIVNGPEGGQYASMSMAGLDPRDPSQIYKGDGFDFSERSLQYWPETINDSIDIGWNFRDIPGGSHALAQWASNNGRTITFDVQLSRFMIPSKSRSAKEQVLAALEQPASEFPVDNRPYNVNIADQIRFLRGFCYPTYLDIEGVVSALPPPIMLLHVPGVGLNEYGSDTIYCVMTGCDVVYNLLFRDGTPRRATVSITVRQIIQTKDGVKFKGFGTGAPSRVNMDYAYKQEELNKNAGRSTNKIDPSDLYG